MTVTSQQTALDAVRTRRAKQQLAEESRAPSVLLRAASVDDQDRSSWTERPAMRTSMEERDRPPSAGGRLSRPGSPRRSRPPSPRLSRPASPHVDHLLPRQGRHFLKPILIIFSQTKLLSAPAAVSRNGTSFLHFHFPNFHFHSVFHNDFFSDVPPNISVTNRGLAVALLFTPFFQSWFSM